MKVNSKGQVVIRYGILLRLIAVGFLVFFTILGIGYFLEPSMSNNTAGKILLVIFWLIILAAALHITLTWLAYDDVGIELHNPFLRPVYILWLEAWVVKDSEGGMGIHSPDAKIFLIFFEEGLPELMEAIKKHIPSERMP